MLIKSSPRVNKVILILSLASLLLVLLFTLFPRPILLSNDPNEIELFFQTHTGLFYKILYAQSSSVALGNYFLFTFPAFLFKLRFTNIAEYKIFFAFLTLSIFIELAQMAIPGRVSDGMDLFANGVSGLIGLILAKILIKR